MYKAHTDIKSGSKSLGYKICKGESGEGECLLVISDRRQRRIPLSSIKYVESRARKLTLHLGSEEVCFYAKLADVEPVLEKRGFVRTHQSYMVRVGEIKGWNIDCVSIDDTRIPVSRRYYKNVRELTNEMERGGVKIPFIINRCKVHNE